MLLTIVGPLVIFTFIFIYYMRKMKSNITNSYQYNQDKTLLRNTYKNMYPAVCIWISIYTAIMLFILFISYQSYVDTRTFYDATMEQYTSAIEIYENKAVIDIESVALTDLKYNGYQESVSILIIDLREGIVNYNKEIISKRILKKNIIFSWLIIAPDADMTVITMKGKT